MADSNSVRRDETNKDGVGSVMESTKSLPSNEQKTGDKKALSKSRSRKAAALEKVAPQKRAKVETSEDEANENGYESDPDPGEHYSSVLAIVMNQVEEGYYDNYGRGRVAEVAVVGTGRKPIDPYSVARDLEKEEGKEGEKPLRVLIITSRYLFNSLPPEKKSDRCVVIRVMDGQVNAQLNKLIADGEEFELVYLNCDFDYGGARDQLLTKIAGIPARKLVINSTHTTKETFPGLVKNKREVLIQAEHTTMFTTAYTEIIEAMGVEVATGPLPKLRYFGAHIEKNPKVIKRMICDIKKFLKKEYGFVEKKAVKGVIRFVRPTFKIIFENNFLEVEVTDPHAV